jgi:hypothetical protein
MSLPIPIHDGTYTTWKERSEYFARLHAAVAAMPQVVAAGISTNATPAASGGDTPLEILGSSALEKPNARANFVSSECAAVPGIRQARVAVADRELT